MTLDVGTDAEELPWPFLRDLAQVLQRADIRVEKMEKRLRHFASGFKRLHVEMITTADRRQHEEESRARWEQEAAAAAEPDGDKAS